MAVLDEIRDSAAGQCYSACRVVQSWGELVNVLFVTCHVGFIGGSIHLHACHAWLASVSQEVVAWLPTTRFHVTSNDDCASTRTYVIQNSSTFRFL